LSYIDDVIAWLRSERMHVDVHAVSPMAYQCTADEGRTLYAPNARIMADWIERHRSTFADVTETLLGPHAERAFFSLWLHESEHAPAYCAPPWGRNFTKHVAAALARGAVP
jgi:hypothetical protein